MKQMEFRSRVDSNGQIIIPEYFKKKIRRGTLVNVSVVDEEREDKMVFNMYGSYEERKRYWDQYEMNDIWNGE